ncbi:MAG: type II toxin-antitoxin system RelE/ParE family toxin [Mucilaginibacter sp.]
MAKKDGLTVYWTNRSISDSLNIKEYLNKEFSQREIDNFYKLLEAFEKIVLSFPNLYPQSIKNKKVYRAVLSKQLSVYYKLSRDQIIIIAVLDNRVGFSRWP